MEFDKKFEKFYDELVNEESHFSKLKNEMKNESLRNILVVSILIVIGVVVLFYAVSNMINSSMYYFVPIAYVLIAFFIKNKFCGNDKQLEYILKSKERIMNGILKLSDKNAVYYKNSSIGSEIYDEAEFEKYDRYTSDFSVFGKLNNDYSYNFGDVKTEYLEGNVKYHKYTNLFQGLFVYVDCPNKFKDSIYIKNMDNIFFRKTGYYKVPSKKMKVEFDSLDFDKEFDVYTSNKKVVIELLNSNIREVFINFRKEMNIRFEMTIKDDKIYYRFFCGNFFKINKYSSNPLNKKAIYNYYKAIDFCLSISEKLIDVAEKI
ncbi:MAG: DUF3137 domain-containing protein [Bacilli bacterium]|nr:DUF3137 domain-containing protein [Bacilli bacterium]